MTMWTINGTPCPDINTADNLALAGARVSGHVGSVNITVELLAMACRGLGPGQPTAAELLRHHLAMISDQATRLRNKAEDSSLSDTDIQFATSAIVGHVYEARQHLGAD